MADAVGLRVNSIVSKAAAAIAERPADEWPRWIIHVLAVLDPCEPEPGGFDASVLRRVQEAIAARLESGHW